MSSDHCRPSLSIHFDTVVIEAEMFDPVETARCKRKRLPIPPGGCLKREGGGPPWYVRPPYWLERLFGITFKGKVQKAMLKAKQWCDERNDIFEKTRRLLKKLNEEADKLP